ncbi:Asp-tRNA(Asn)/Glu-tRNA(Gln) amidotransferase subunit GatC [Gleimia sp. 6138-11-ORH1]|uniref:Asp-tRNA(Asn)/Glu-tRNA(Gln) amidotransferase subunit GatC n=1 Tax=Gleimia sp. 6138-11-ORH1 TaxID=2973937 RepID=UPI00216A6528|nr:Asp-tRNA(Asn)/Glu-tRNA(Gln) amidotransferase subunit GatC [Gleimia sp. 6138-11-ORH1]MCS4485249.1 Asp-tRNA(Asn)/Glu-tRNA(Gln) amidotransferase subunit GatC [Gleimia sp. 6138-11-ORH1]
MSTFTNEEVRYLAQLAHIALTEEEISKMASELGVIADSVAKVASIVDAQTPSTSHPIPLVNVMREDVVGELLDREEVLASAPVAESGQFMVPQILGED